MKIIWTCTIAAAAFAASIATANATASGCAVVVDQLPGGFLNLRQAPTEKAPVRAKLKPGWIIAGDTQECYRKDGASICPDLKEWSHVTGVYQLDGGRGSAKTEGWIASKYVKSIEDCPATTSGPQMDALPVRLLGEWCFDTQAKNFRRESCRSSADHWLSIQRTGFTRHEMRCKLQSASSNRTGQYRTQFKCDDEAGGFTVYYWIGLDAGDQSRLFLDETDSTFTATPDQMKAQRR